jgi:hypothetical protein
MPDLAQDRHQLLRRQRRELLLDRRVRLCRSLRAPIGGRRQAVRPGIMSLGDDESDASQAIPTGPLTLNAPHGNGSYVDSCFLVGPRRLPVEARSNPAALGPGLQVPPAR